MEKSTYSPLNTLPTHHTYKGVQFRCINATTGTEIWTIDGYGSSGALAIADGYMVYLNLYDMQLYTVGRGPSATTVTASPKVSVQGSSVVIEGTVTDIASGTQQNEQVLVFQTAFQQFLTIA